MQEKNDGKYIAIPASSSAIEPNVLLNSDALPAKLQELLDNQDILNEVRAGRIEIREAVQLAARFAHLSHAISKLESFLLLGENRESVYQDWVKLHSWIFGAEYYEADTERGLTAHDSVDAYLPNCTNGFREILELKAPDMSVLRWDDDHRNHYFSAPVSKTIGQVHRYLEKFSEYAAKGLNDSPEIVAHHPCATIVIGRSNDWDESMHRSLHGLNARLNGIKIVTFDYLLLRGKRMLEIMGKTENSD